ncbi:complement C5 isoform X2 [Festucalex cinctus]
MEVRVLMLLVCCACWTASARQGATYLVSAPKVLHVDAVETVLVQMFGITEAVTVYVFVKTSMAPDQQVLSRQVVTLNTANRHQAVASVKVSSGQLDKNRDHVILHVHSAQINEHVSLPVSWQNGFLFVQTDKPLYTPTQSVEVRAFSLNQELHPANRSVFLTFKDPDHQIVDVQEILDLNNGIPSLKDPFKIPIRPKLGIWSIEAEYSDHFSTKAATHFEIREYVLPSFSIVVRPQVNYISFQNFQQFCFKVEARYRHGAPVSSAELYLRYGYVSPKELPVIIPNYVTRATLSSGEANECVNMDNVLSGHEGPKNLDALVGRFLYIAVLLQEQYGGISQEAEFSAVKFVKSPYTLTLVSTPPFIKPGLPYKIQVLVTDPLEKAVPKVPVRVLEQRVWGPNGQEMDMKACPDHEDSRSQSEGVAVFVCNTPATATRASFTFETSHPSLGPESQALLVLTAVAYQSPNRRYLYIDLPLSGEALQVGGVANIKVYSPTPAYVPVDTLSFLVLSKGKTVHFGSHRLVASGNQEQHLSFPVTTAMVPSVRVLVYYMAHAEGVAELVADSVRLKVAGACVNGLRTELSYGRRDYKPKEKLQLDVTTGSSGKGLVAFSAVDSALYHLYPNYRDPVTTVLRHIEQTDLGCGGGGGKDAADVFRLAGLTFITNANAQPATDAGAAPCTAAVRGKRALTQQEKQAKAASFGNRRPCCVFGMAYLPSSVSCQQFAQQQFRRRPDAVECRQIFIECCQFVQRNLLGSNLILARHGMGANFDAAPSLVRTFFPESWLWETKPISGSELSITRTLPDSLTTWELKAIGMFRDGMCVSDTARVSVQLPLSVDVPLPYQVIRGEQLELSGSVYNQQADTVTFCVTLTVGPQVCLLHSQPAGAGFYSSVCQWSELPAKGVAKVTFTLMGLEAGEHTLTFTLKTEGRGAQDIVEKKLRVVPEGVRMEDYSGGILDPQGLYGSEKTTVVLKNRPPANMVPNTKVERMLTINGEVFGDVLSMVLDPEGLRQLVNLPSGSLEVELGRVLPLALVYRYLEATQTWDYLDGDIGRNSAHIRQKIKEGLVSIYSFRRGDYSYGMWTKREASTWLTAAAVGTLAAVDPVLQVDRRALAQSVSWLILNAQHVDGSFVDTSAFRANKFMAEGVEPLERSLYLTSLVYIALHRATAIKERFLQLKFHDESMIAAANYISQHALSAKSVYVRALATYALTFHDLHHPTRAALFNSLETLAREKGHPATLRYWQESDAASDWLRPDQSGGLTLETTAYVLLSVLRKGRIPYAKPIVSWLTQDQHRAQGFHSLQATVLTLEALTEYGRVVTRAELDQHINVGYVRKETLARVQLGPRRPVATPIQVTKNDDITVSTGYGTGVSSVKMKTTYYQTTPPSHNCNFELRIGMVGGADAGSDMRDLHLTACAKYKPPPNEVATESTMTVMKIQLPTGVDARLEDLRQFRDAMDPVVSHYELQGNTVVIQMDSVPSDTFLCLGFRIHSVYKVGGATHFLLTLSEPQDEGSMCSKSFSDKEQKLQRLCVADQCLCMSASCATYRSGLSLTPAERLQETCRPHIKYAYKVQVKSQQAEGDFVSFTANVRQVLKNVSPAFAALGLDSEVELIKKVTCTSVGVDIDQQYLLMGSSGSEVRVGHAPRFRLPLDADAILEPWPALCGGDPTCSAQTSSLEEYAVDLQLFGCPQD